jgi:hypothetical protein
MRVLCERSLVGFSRAEAMGITLLRLLSWRVQLGRHKATSRLRGAWLGMQCSPALLASLL